jgi:PAS domain S-box-containing protein
MSTTILRRIAERTPTAQKKDKREPAISAFDWSNGGKPHRPAGGSQNLSEECFRSVWTHSLDGMRLTDSRGRIVDVNPAYCRLVGMPREALLGQLFTETHDKPLRAEALSSYLERFESESLVAHLATCVHLWNSEERELEISNSFVELGQQGKLVLGIFRDVTERKRAEAELAHERDLLQAMLDHLPDAIYFKDRQSQFVRVSKSKLEKSYAIAMAHHQKSAHGGADPLPPYLATMGEFANFMSGKTDFDFLPEERARSAYQDEQEIINTGKPVVGKLECTNQPDGTTTWCLTTKVAWRDRQGQIIGTLGISRDITSLKEAESRVETINKELIRASRQAGMAEVATGVLHNVGNVLNSVNVSARVVADMMRQSKVANLAKAVDLLREHESDMGVFIAKDPKGKQLPGYLAQLAEHLANEQVDGIKELEDLTKNIDHINDIVTMQQTYARVSGCAETVQPTELAEDALRMNISALARHDIEVIRDYERLLPEIVVDRHKVLQILINLVRNAKYACDEVERPDKRMTVRVFQEANRITISVADNGIGIPAENLTRIFNHGFTTRKNGHGFGLHSGAIAARELGGALHAHSDGPRQGATFTLELPLTFRGCNGD